jgi:hypothetical protein
VTLLRPTPRDSDRVRVPPVRRSVTMKVCNGSALTIITVALRRVDATLGSLGASLSHSGRVSRRRHAISLCLRIYCCSIGLKMVMMFARHRLGGCVRICSAGAVPTVLLCHATGVAMSTALLHGAASPQRAERPAHMRSSSPWRKTQTAPSLSRIGSCTKACWRWARRQHHLAQVSVCGSTVTRGRRRRVKCVPYPMPLCQR